MRGMNVIRSLMAIALIFFFSINCSSLKKGSVAGADPIEQVYLFENHSESYLIWKSHHVKSRILLHFDGHVDVDWIPDPFLEEIISCPTVDDLKKRIAHPYERKSGFQGHISIWNFLYPALRSNMIRDFYWIVPDGTFRSQSVLERFRSSLGIKMHGITPSELQSLKLLDDRISGQLFGIPFTIVEMEHLPSFEERVLLDIDLDYFSTKSAIYQTVLLDPSCDPEAFMKRLAKKKIRTDLVTISYSSVGGFFPVRYHYFGDVLARMMRDPRSIMSEEGLQESSRDDPIYREALLHEADAVRGAGQLEKAIELYKKFIAGHPESSHLSYARQRLGTILADAGRSEEALRELKEFVLDYPDDPDARYYLGRLYKEKGQIKEALSELREAVAMDSFNGIYAAELGALLLASGREEEALQWLDQALKWKPCNANAHMTLGIYYWKKGDLSQTEKELKSSLFVRSWNPTAHYLLGKVYYHQRRYMEAREEWQKVLNLVPDHPGARRALSALGWK